VVDLDFVLLHRAKRLINGANVHQVNQLILGYELAVSLHNSGPSPHLQYQDQYENAVSTAAMLLERSLRMNAGGSHVIGKPLKLCPTG